MIPDWREPETNKPGVAESPPAVAMDDGRIDAFLHFNSRPSADSRDCPYGTVPSGIDPPNQGMRRR